MRIFSKKNKLFQKTEIQKIHGYRLFLTLSASKNCEDKWSTFNSNLRGTINASSKNLNNFDEK